MPAPFLYYRADARPFSTLSSWCPPLPLLSDLRKTMMPALTADARAHIENDGHSPPPPPPPAQRNDLCKTMQHTVFKRGQVTRGIGGEYSNYGVVGQRRKRQPAWQPKQNGRTRKVGRALRPDL